MDWTRITTAGKMDPKTSTRVDSERALQLKGKFLKLRHRLKCVTPNCSKGSWTTSSAKDTLRFQCKVCRKSLNCSKMEELLDQLDLEENDATVSNCSATDTPRDASSCSRSVDVCVPGRVAADSEVVPGTELRDSHQLATGKTLLSGGGRIPVTESPGQPGKLSLGGGAVNATLIDTMGPYPGVGVPQGRSASTPRHVHKRPRPLEESPRTLEESRQIIADRMSSNTTAQLRGCLGLSHSSGTQDNFWPALKGEVLTLLKLAGLSGCDLTESQPILRSLLGDCESMLGTVPPLPELESVPVRGPNPTSEKAVMTCGEVSSPSGKKKKRRAKAKPSGGGFWVSETLGSGSAKVTVAPPSLAKERPSFAEVARKVVAAPDSTDTQAILATIRAPPRKPSQGARRKPKVDAEQLKTVYFSGLKFMRISELRSKFRLLKMPVHLIYNISYVDRDTVELLVTQEAAPLVTKVLEDYAFRLRDGFTPGKAMDPRASDDVKARIARQFVSRVQKLSQCGHPVVREYFRSLIPTGDSDHTLATLAATPTGGQC